ncbi:MAG: hypothetical protein KDJ86_01870 [Bauldia sp.]|uniref:DUF6650 family protein n=1 Tax=Bauldia sp. TaxID=2575872 RepID=UPI001E065277|nr:DUF6650 family protein [Bauldia sp.]MCB1494507.1 hypothetical protein [Bauldia sp.]
MRFKEVLSRITGLSSPIFGVSWNPPQADVTVARRIVTFLEDRRVLYVPSEMEIPHHCVDSVLEIRRFLTGELSQIGEQSEISETIRAMRAACRKFLNTVGERSETVAYGAERGHWASWVFNGALGEMRGVFGVHVAKLAASYGLDVEDGLAAIIPEGEDGTLTTG